MAVYEQQSGGNVNFDLAGFEYEQREGSTVDIELSVDESAQLTGTLQSSSELTGSLTLFNKQLLTGTVEGSSDIQGELTQILVKRLSGAATAEGSLSAELSRTLSVTLSGDMTGNGELTGTIFTDAEAILSGDINASSELSGELVSLNESVLTGSIDSQGLLSADISFTREIPLTGSIQGSGDLNGLLRQELTEELQFEEFTPQKLASTGRKNARALANQIGDPVNRPSGQMVYDSMPRVKSQGFNGYPFIVVEEYTFNDIGDTINGLNTEYDFDVELHIYGLEESEDDLMAMDQILDELNYLVKGPNSVRLGAEARLARPQFIRQNRLTGINEKDQPIVRYEVEIRGKLHLNMDR